jgi:hypothetical protein
VHSLATDLFFGEIIGKNKKYNGANYLDFITKSEVRQPNRLLINFFIKMGYA